MASPFDYTNKAVFVAGGSSGINLGIAHAFAAAGANVAIASRSQDRIDSAVTELLGHGGEVAGYSADVRDYAAFAGVLAQATSGSAISMPSSPVRPAFLLHRRWACLPTASRR